MFLAWVLSPHKYVLQALQWKSLNIETVHDQTISRQGGTRVDNVTLLQVYLFFKGDRCIRLHPAPYRQHSVKLVTLLGRCQNNFKKMLGNAEGARNAYMYIKACCTSLCSVQGYSVNIYCISFCLITSCLLFLLHNPPAVFLQNCLDIFLVLYFSPIIV